MTAEIHQLKRKPVATNWMCSACGEDASCNCGAALVSKAKRAADALAADPRKSNRAIADETGISEATVRRARGASCDAPDEDDERIGKDGKTYPARVVRDDPDEDDPKEIRKAFLYHSYHARLLANYDGPIDAEVIQSVSQTAVAWSQLANSIKGNANG